MTKLTWDATGQRLYETGVDRGVLYVNDDKGDYGVGVPWNGLIGVTESPQGAEPTPIYADNIKYLTLISNEEFKATIEAYTYPEEFEECDGSLELVEGLTVGQQARKKFGFSYRTILGNDTASNEHGRKIHLVYGCRAQPSDKSYQTVNDSPEAMTFSWEINTDPVEMWGQLRPTSLLTIDSTRVEEEDLKALETILYGGEEAEPRLPLPSEVAQLLGFNVE